MAETSWRKSDLYKTFGKKFVTKKQIVFQVFDVVLAADEGLFKHGNIQVSKYYNLEKYYVTVPRLGKLLHFSFNRWNGRPTGLFQMTLERV